jgi:hypothetical protein
MHHVNSFFFLSHDYCVSDQLSGFRFVIKKFFFVAVTETCMLRVVHEPTCSSLWDLHKPCRFCECPIPVIHALAAHCGLLV